MATYYFAKSMNYVGILLMWPLAFEQGRNDLISKEFWVFHTDSGSLSLNLKLKTFTFFTVFLLSYLLFQ